VFPSAEAVCQAAIEMQWRMTELPSIGGEPLAIRIAFHFGAAVERDDDVFGDSVNVAARLTEMANGQQIITSAQSLQDLPLELSSYARHLWPVSVRGRSEPVDLYEILWNGGTDATVTLSAHFEPARIPVRLRLLYQGREVAVSPDRPQVSIGRDGANELVVEASNASRVHARVEWRVDKFVLIDLSTNGTYVLSSDDQETSLRREELILNGDGAISLGVSNRVSPLERIRFFSEYMGAPSRAAGRAHSVANG
jgi:adenylate cyclase